MLLNDNRIGNLNLKEFLFFFDEIKNDFDKNYDIFNATSTEYNEKE